jgi:ribosomal protein S27E
MVGSVGCGGPAEILFSPRGGEAKMLEEGVSDHRHQRMAMKTSP